MASINSEQTSVKKTLQYQSKPRVPGTFLLAVYREEVGYRDRLHQEALPIDYTKSQYTSTLTHRNRLTKGKSHLGQKRALADHRQMAYRVSRGPK